MRVIIGSFRMGGCVEWDVVAKIVENNVQQNRLDYFVQS